MYGPMRWCFRFFERMLYEMNKIGSIDGLEKIMKGFGSKMKEIDYSEEKRKNKKSYL